MKQDPELIYFGKVKDGAISLPKKMRTEMVQAFDGEIEVRVRRKRNRRTTQANNYYWGGLVSPISLYLREVDLETGWTIELTHEMLKARFLPNVREWAETVIPDTGEVIKEPYTTTKTTKGEFYVYCELVAKFAAEMGIQVGEPEEQLTFQL